jgi:hypothetical protein
MEQLPKLKVNMSTYRRLNIQHKMDETMLKQKHLLNLQTYKHREEIFQKKVDRLKKSFEHIQPYINDQQTLITSNCFNRIKTHFHLLKFSPQSQERLLSNHLPNIHHRVNSNYQKTFEEFLNQQISNEHKNQLKNNERKIILLKEFDELKHTINDPHSTLSVLAALSRALLYLDSEIKLK